MATKAKYVYVVNQHVDAFNQLTVWGVFKTKQAVWDRFGHDRSTDGIGRNSFYKMLDGDNDDLDVSKNVSMKSLGYGDYGDARVTFFFFKRELE